MVRDVDIAWAAGYIDGEGTITIRRNTQNLDPTYYPFLVIPSTREESISHLERILTGSRRRTAKPHGVNSRHCFIIYWNGLKALEVCKAIDPYTVLKQKHIQIVKELYTTQTRKGIKVPLEETSRRESLWKKMVELNKRGVG